MEILSDLWNVMPADLGQDSKGFVRHPNTVPLGHVNVEISHRYVDLSSRSCHETCRACSFVIIPPDRGGAVDRVTVGGVVMRWRVAGWLIKLAHRIYRPTATEFPPDAVHGMSGPAGCPPKTGSQSLRDPGED